MTFRVGQKVVFVDDTPTQSECGPGSYWLPNWPVLGQVYTIRAFVDDDAVFLEEVRNPVREFLHGVSEGSFYCWRFRPVQERKTDISIFTAMLTPNKRRVEA